MQSSQQYPLSDIIHVAEFTVRGKEEGKQGRSYDIKKKKIIIAVELTNKHKVKRVYVKSINRHAEAEYWWRSQTAAHTRIGRGAGCRRSYM